MVASLSTLQENRASIAEQFQHIFRESLEGLEQIALCFRAHETRLILTRQLAAYELNMGPFERMHDQQTKKIDDNFGTEPSEDRISRLPKFNAQKRLLA